MGMVILANPAHATRLLAQYAAWKQRPADPEPDPDPEPSGIVADAVVLFGRGGGQVTGEQPVIDWRDLLPTVELFTHTYLGPDPTGIARVEGVGAVSEAWVRDVLGPQCRITHRPVIDIAGQAPSMPGRSRTDIAGPCA